MRVTLSDPMVMVEGWTGDLDKAGEYTLRVRKTPEELRLEKEELKKLGLDHDDPVTGRKAKHISKFHFYDRTCISHDALKPGVAYFLPGLWPRVRGMLEEKGVQYELVDRRNPAIRPPLDYTAFQGVEFRETQDMAVALISQLDCGIIETTTGYGKSFLLSLLCKAYPTLNIVVTTSSTQVVSTLYKYLCQTIPGQVGVLYGGKDTTSGKRVVCTTLKSLGNMPPEKVRLVFVDECHAVGDNLAGEELMKFKWARRFGFSASPVRNDGTARVMEALLGPTILKMTYQEAADAGMVTPMKYLMLPCSKCPQVAQKKGLGDNTLRKWSYWRNNARNGVIRDFVYDLKRRYDGQILIMVSTMEHAIALHMMLPWFMVAHAENLRSENLRAAFPEDKYPNLDIGQYKLSSGQLERMKAAFAKGTLRYVIATKSWKQGVNFEHLAVIVRADGDVSDIECIQIPGRASRLDDDKEWAYLVDILDMFSPWASQRANARMAEYENQQWKKIDYMEMMNGIGRTATPDNVEPAG